MDFNRLANMANRAITRAFREGPGAVVWRPVTGGEFPIDAVFDEAYTSVDLQQGVPVTSTRPMLWVELSRLPALPLQEDRFTVTTIGRTFEVIEVQDEGRGSAKLIAFEVTP